VDFGHGAIAAQAWGPALAGRVRGNQTALLLVTAAIVIGVEKTALSPRRCAHVDDVLNESPARSTITNEGPARVSLAPSDSGQISARARVYLDGVTFVDEERHLHL